MLMVIRKNMSKKVRVVQQLHNLTDLRIIGKRIKCGRETNMHSDRAKNEL